MSECIADDGNNNHWPGYFNGKLLGDEPDYYGIKRMNLVQSFSSFISGCGFINIDDIRFQPLQYAKMYNCHGKITRMADLRAALGWNVACDCTYNIGLNIQAAAPTGNRPEGFYLFEPIVGNGKHWEIGAGLNAHYTFWSSVDECNYVGMYLDANITHLMGAKQVRTFDLCGKPLSRYMLACQLEKPVNNLLAGPATKQEKPNKQFTGIYEPVANLTTFSVEVSVGAQADIVLMLQAVYSNLSFDIGYNFWGKTCENIDFRCDCPCPFEENEWGLKGDAFTYGFKSNGSITNESVPLSATQSRATITRGTNRWPNGFDGFAYPQNPGVDNRARAWFDSTTELVIYDVKNQKILPINTSFDPVLIKFCDVDLAAAQTRGMSHKFFVHIDYTWRRCDCWVPYIGFGGEVEFGQRPQIDSGCNSCYNSCTPCGFGSNLCGSECNSNCTCCNLCALSQWGVWLKGGVGFN